MQAAWALDGGKEVLQENLFRVYMGKSACLCFLSPSLLLLLILLFLTKCLLFFDSPRGQKMSERGGGGGGGGGGGEKERRYLVSCCPEKEHCKHIKRFLFFLPPTMKLPTFFAKSWSEEIWEEVCLLLPLFKVSAEPSIVRFFFWRLNDSYFPEKGDEIG